MVDGVISKVKELGTRVDQFHDKYRWAYTLPEDAQKELAGMYATIRELYGDDNCPNTLRPFLTHYHNTLHVHVGNLGIDTSYPVGKVHDEPLRMLDSIYDAVEALPVDELTKAKIFYLMDRAAHQFSALIPHYDSDVPNDSDRIRFLELAKQHDPTGSYEDVLK